MTRQRLRPMPTPEAMADFYRTPHNHLIWQDHIIRVNMTIDFGRRFMETHGGGRVGADLSCGSAAVLNGLDLDERYLGDLAPGYDLTGPIEETIQNIPDVDVFVNTETAEHLDDPDLMLSLVRAKTRMLILSTPVDAWDDSNLEHLWAWSREDVEEMLAGAGFHVSAYDCVDFRPNHVYKFGIWGCT